MSSYGRFPGVLKNAFDSALGTRLRNKPAGLSYSGGPIAGARAVEHMVGITVEREMAPLRNAVLIGQIGRAFDPDGLPVDPMTDHARAILLDDLAWWGDALRSARAAGELPPPRQRPVHASPGPVRRLVAEQVAGAGAEPGGPVVGVAEPAALQ